MEVEMRVSDHLRRQACDPCRKRKVRCSRHNAPLCERCSHFGLNCEYSPTKTMGRPRRRRSAQFADAMSGAFMGIDGLPGGAMSQSAAFADFPSSLMSFDTSLSPAHPGLLWNPASSQPSNNVAAAPDVVGGQLGPPSSPPQNQPPPSMAAAFSADQNRGGEFPAPLDESSDRQRPVKCQCVVMVNQHFSMVDDSPESFRTLKLLQDSARSAEKILTCSVCFDPDNAGGGLSKNVHLLGSLMSSIATLYGGFILYQRRRAADHLKRNEPLKLVIGEALGEPSVAALTVDGETYWSFLKAAMTSEFARLQRLSEAFSDRQTDLHSKGHEACEKGNTCTRTEVCSPVIQPADACPTKVEDIRSHFSCFRTVEHVRSAIDEAQRLLDS